MKCYFTHMAWKKFQYYIKNCDYEISGLGKTRFQDGDIIIEELICFKQKVTSATTDLDYDDRAKALFNLRKSGENLENWNLWWHSHVNMGVFWSTTDEEAISNDICKIPFHLSVVGNKKGEVLTRVDVALKSLKDEVDIGDMFHTIDKIETFILKREVPQEIQDSVNEKEMEALQLEEEIKRIAKRIKEVREESDILMLEYDEYPELEKEIIKEIKEKVSTPYSTNTYKMSVGVKNLFCCDDDDDEIEYDEENGISFWNNTTKWGYDSSGKFITEKEYLAIKGKKNKNKDSEKDVFNGLVFSKKDKKKDQELKTEEEEPIYAEINDDEFDADDEFYYRKLKINGNPILNQQEE